LKIFFNLFFIVVVFVHAETSMFGAGDLNSPKPYGLTETEKVIVKNKQTIKNTEKKIYKVDTKLKDVYESVDGIESIIEGESQKLNELSKKFTTQTTEIGLLSETTQNHTKELELLKFQLEQNTQNIQTIKKSLDKLIATMNKINKDYISRKEFNKLLAMLDKKEAKKVVKKTPKAGGVPNKPNKELMADVRVLFKKDYFTKAKPIIEHLIAKNYRPAENNYYLGEINYYRKNYKDALHYFKTSMMLYDKASWLPKLLLHSAISFEKLGDNENAQSFYSTIVDVYPDTAEAKEASKKIK